MTKLIWALLWLNVGLCIVMVVAGDLLSALANALAVIGCTFCLLHDARQAPTWLRHPSDT